MPPKKQSERPNDKILIFIGKVEEHMKYSNEIQKDYVIDRKDIYEKMEGLGNRQTKIEEKQGFIMKTGGIMIIAIIGFFTRGYWMGK
ncbi:MAG TPA: hypothetical protein ENH85_11165 [Candidatus Scalindua sp.]|nr:hypothetical protein [Candidatus Scalindua sp.]